MTINLENHSNNLEVDISLEYKNVTHIKQVVSLLSSLELMKLGKKIVDQILKIRVLNNLFNISLNVVTNQHTKINKMKLHTIKIHFGYF